METKLPNEERRAEKPPLADVSDLPEDMDLDERVGSAAPSRPPGRKADEPALCPPSIEEAEAAAIQRPPADS